MKIDYILFNAVFIIKQLKMKLSIFFLLFSLNTFAQTTYYVWAKSGLNLRSEPKTSGKKLATIPFGTKLDEVDYIDSEYTTDSVLLLENPSLKLSDKTLDTQLSV
jgi:hypothetical protein